LRPYPLRLYGHPQRGRAGEEVGQQQVGRHEVEGRAGGRHLAERSPGDREPVRKPVAGGVGPRRHNGVRVAVDADRLGGPQCQRRDTEHAAAAAGVEHPLAAPDQAFDRRQRQPRRRVGPAAEGPPGIDQYLDGRRTRACGQPGRADPQPPADRHGPGEGAPRVQRAVDVDRRHLGGPPVLDCGQQRADPGTGGDTRHQQDPGGSLTLLDGGGSRPPQGVARQVHVGAPGHGDRDDVGW
jgi:hypothetical protein